MRTTLDNPFVVFGEGADFIRPGATVTLAGPTVGADTVNVTFAAEAQPRGSDPGDNFDWAQLEVLSRWAADAPGRPGGQPDGTERFALLPHERGAVLRTDRGWHVSATGPVRLADNGTPDGLVEWNRRLGAGGRGVGVGKVTTASRARQGSRAPLAAPANPKYVLRNHRSKLSRPARKRSRV